MAYLSPYPVILFPLQEQIFAKDGTGPLAGGVVSFYQDSARTNPKDVYEQTQLSPPSGDYSFVNIGSVLTLSSIGTFVDSNGKNFIPFLYPYGSNDPAEPVPSGGIDLYYITVYDSQGVLQFTVDAYPPNTEDESDISPATQTVNALNQISNPQFQQVSFVPASGTTISVSGTGTVTPIAPDWSIITTGSGTVTLSQLSISSSQLTEPAFGLGISSTGVTGTITLQQVLPFSPRLFAGQYVAGYLAAASNMVIPITINYIPSSPASTSYAIASASTTSDSVYHAIAGVSALIPVTSTDGNTGNVTIQISFPINATTVNITSVQILGVSNNEVIPNYIQNSASRQADELFHYAQPQLNYKPIPSYLIGWDFPLNPAQPNGASCGPFTFGTGHSGYVWDQTIVFQTTEDKLAFSREANGGFVVTPSAGGSSFSIIQYIEQNRAREILSQQLSVAVIGASTANLNASVNLYWTTNTGPIFPALPASIITSIATGAIPTTASGWTLVPRNTLDTASFVLSNGSGATPNYFSGWFEKTGAAQTTATGMAVVMTFDVLSSGIMWIQYCSLVPGLIATRPAPQTNDEVIRECQYYFEMSYTSGNAIGTSTGVGEVAVVASGYEVLTSGSSYVGVVFPEGFNVSYKVQKRVAPTLTFYSPSTGTAANVYAVVNCSNGTQTATPVGGDNLVSSYWSVSGTASINSASFIPNTYTALQQTANTSFGSGAPSAYGYMAYQYTADCRLGVV